MPHPDIPSVEHHPADCCCFVCYCLRVERSRSKADRLRNKKLCLV